MRCSLNLSPKVLADSPIYSSITFHPVTLIPIDDATLLGDVFSVFGCHQEVFDCLASSKIYLNTILLTGVLETFTQASAVRNSYMGSSDVKLGVCCLFVSYHDFSIVGREDQNLMRLIKEAIYIRVNNPSLNKNIGKYHLPHIWDKVLNNITELKLK